MPEALRKPYLKQGARTMKQVIASAVASAATIKLYIYHAEGLY